MTKVSVEYSGRTVGLIAASDDESKKVAAGLITTIKKKYAEKKIKASGDFRLKTKEARYVGFCQAAWSDDSYFVIPFTGTVTNEVQNNLYKCISAGANGFSRSFEVNRKAGHIVVYEYHGIGD